MIWGSGRLLLRAVSRTRAHACSRAFGIVRTRRVVSSLTALVLVAALVVAVHPFRAAHHTQHEVARGVNLATIQDAPIAAGQSSVSVTGATHHLSPGSLPAVPATERHAFLVGINKAAGGRPLQGAVTDALNVKRALLDYGFPPQNITTLLDGQATRAAILAGLDDIARRTPASGVAVVAIASHSRQYGGIDQLLAADGKRVDSTEIAARMQKVRSRAWIALPTCFAGGYALPGIVGHNRIATFASDAGSESYEIGSAGSYLILDMVREAMIERRAPDSVESAFAWAKAELERTNPDRVPYMSDGIDGDLVLGEMAGAPSVEAAPPPPDRHRSSAGPQKSSGGSNGGSSDGAPSGDPGHGSNGTAERTSVEMCGSYRLNCSNP